MNRRDGRVYIALDHNMTEHPKIEQLTDEAFRALIECWCWCSRHETDGRMPQASWDKRVPVASAKQLLDLCLAHAGDGYIEMHDYTEHQRTAEEIQDLRSRRKAAGRLGGLAKASKSVASAKAPAKQTPSKPVAETETETETTTDLKDSLSSPTGPDDEPRQEVVELCEQLASLVIRNGHKPPTIGKTWHRDMRLLLDVDKRTPEQVRKAIDWSQDDPFWSANIRSAGTLREKYDTLRARAAQETKPKTNGYRTNQDRNDDIFSAAEERARQQELREIA